jgi:hypothetical protein
MSEGLCHLCHTALPTPELLEHLRLMHPDDYGDGPERWPDGGPVVIDQTGDLHRRRHAAILCWRYARTVLLGPPLVEAEEYEACGAHQGQTHGGMSEWPSCWQRKGHDGPHEDPAVVVRWYDQPVLTFAAAPMGDESGEGA